MTGTSKGEAYIEYDFSLYMEMVTQYNEKRVFPEMEIPAQILNIIMVSG